MPQSWHNSWQIAELAHLEEFDPERLARQMEREGAINKLGNLTLLTGALNSSVSNGPYSVKMPAVRSHSSLALNRELNGYDDWNEQRIAERGSALFKTAREIWQAPDRQEGMNPISPAWAEITAQRSGLPTDGTACRFAYFGKSYSGRIESGALVIDGIDGRYNSFSAASRAITETNRNGWNDWHILENGGWTLADEWRKRPSLESAQTG